MAITKRSMQIYGSGRNVRPRVTFQPQQVHLPSHIWGRIVNVSELSGLGRMICSEWKVNIPEPCTTLVSSISTPEMAQWASERGLALNQQFWLTTLKAGHLSVLKWLYVKGVNPAYNSCLLAAAAGHLEILKWLIEIGCHLGASIVEAARNGHVEVVEWLLQRNPCQVRYRQPIAEAAAAGGHVRVLELLLSESLRWTPCYTMRECLNDCLNNVYVADVAVKGLHVNVLQWLFDHGFISGLSSKTCQTTAITTRDMSVIEWMHQHTLDIPVMVYVEVAVKGPALRNMLYWAVNHNPSLKRFAFYLFIQWGELSELVHLHSMWVHDVHIWIQNDLNACAFCTVAASYNQPVILSWLHRLGFSFNKDTYLAAMSAGHHGIMAWLFQNGCPVPEPDDA